MSKTYLGIYSGLTSSKLSNTFHMCGLIKDLKSATFHFSFPQEAVNRFSLQGLCLGTLASLRGLGSAEKRTLWFQNLLFPLDPAILA